MGDSDTAKAVTMDESHNLKWKSSWRDEYLKWICGFANAQGGLLVIGKNDRGEAVGVKDPLRLLEEIPNKTQSLLGIVVNVDLQSEERGEYLEIRTWKSGSSLIPIQSATRASTTTAAAVPSRS